MFDYLNYMILRLLDVIIKYWQYIIVYNIFRITIQYDLKILTIMIIFIGTFIEYKYYNKDNYQKLLEFPNNYFHGKEDMHNINLSHPLMISMDTFCIQNDIYKNGAIISLSGGVDSMVTLACLIRLSQIHNFPIYTASIDYSQRKDQKYEIKFLQRYCDNHNVKSYIKTIDGISRKKDTSGKRSEFEDDSRYIRFSLYKKIIDENNCSGVFVGHHKDDIMENIFTNSMKGCNLLNLEGMKSKNNIHGVSIYRPFLDFRKNVILDFAHEYNIPYFLDTTPKWSRRGKMRFEIFPLFDSVFCDSWREKLTELGEQSRNLEEYIDKYIINPWYSSIEIKENGFIIPYQDQPQIIYSKIILKVLHNMGFHMLKKSSINKIIMNCKNYNKTILLDSGFALHIDSNNPQKLIIFNRNLTDITKFM